MSRVINNLKDGIKKWQPWGNLVTGSLILFVDAFIYILPLALVSLAVFVLIYPIKFIETKIFRRELPHVTKLILNNLFAPIVILITALLKICSLLTYVLLKPTGYIIGVIPLLISEVRGYDITLSSFWLFERRMGRNRDYELSSFRDLWATFLSSLLTINRVFESLLGIRLTWTRFNAYALSVHWPVYRGRQRLRREEDTDTYERANPEMARLARRSNLSEEHVMRALQALVMERNLNEESVKLSPLKENSREAIEIISLEMMGSDSAANSKICCICQDVVLMDHEAVIIAKHPEDDLNPGDDVSRGHVLDIIHLDNCWEGFRDSEFRDKVPGSGVRLSDHAILLHCKIDGDFAFHTIENPDFHKSDDFRRKLANWEAEAYEVTSEQGEGEPDAPDAGISFDSQEHLIAPSLAIHALKMNSDAVDTSNDSRTEGSVQSTVSKLQV